MKPVETVLDFVDAVNRRHVDKMVGMMTPDHLFIDSLGNQIPGRRAVRDAWLGCFQMVPDYRITVAETFTDGRTVAVLGSLTGTCSRDGSLAPEQSFTISAAWRAVVERDRIREWQVFADHQPLREAMRRAVEQAREA